MILHTEHRSREGFTIIEAMVAIMVAGIIVVVLGSSMSSASRLFAAGEMSELALTYAIETLELVDAYKNENDFFACSCGGSACPLSLCTASDGQSCTTINEGFTSCWTEFPRNLQPNNGPLHLQNTAGIWGLAAGLETVNSDSRFTRSIQIENLYRSSDTGDFCTPPDTGCIKDTNSKKIIVAVSWLERGHAKNKALSMIVNGWESL